MEKILIATHGGVQSLCHHSRNQRVSNLFCCFSLMSLKNAKTASLWVFVLKNSASGSMEVEYPPAVSTMAPRSAYDILT